MEGRKGKAGTIRENKVDAINSSPFRKYTTVQLIALQLSGCIPIPDKVYCTSMQESLVMSLVFLPPVVTGVCQGLHVCQQQ